MNGADIEELQLRVGIDRKTAIRLLEEFSIMQIGECAPDDDEEVILEFGEICRRLDLPKHVLRKIQADGAIGRPITSGDMHFLRSLMKIYGKAWFIRAQLTNKNKKERERLIQRPELNRWEQWAYSHFLRNTIKYGTGHRMLNPGDRIRIDDLMDTIEDIFKVPKCENTKQQLIKIRKMALNDRCRSKKEGVGVADLSKKRGISGEEPAD
jgi:hypothetical protein